MAARALRCRVALRRDALAAVDRRFSERALLVRRARAGLRRRVRWHQRFDHVAKRGIDLTLATLVLAPMSVILLPVAAWLWARGRVCDRVRCLGKDGRPFDLLIFALPTDGLGRLLRALRVHRVATLFNVLAGEMSLVGPRPVRVGASAPGDRTAGARERVRPGIVGPWWIRQRTNIAYGTEAEVDREYAMTWSPRGDLGLLARAALATLYGRRPAGELPRRISMLGVSIDNVTMDEAVHAIDGWLGAPTPQRVAFVNADCLNIAWRNQRYRDVLEKASLTLGDGIGLKIGGQLLGRPIRQNVNGTDLFPRLCELANRRRARVYLFGARPEVVRGVERWIAARYRDAVVCGTHHGYVDRADEAQVIEQIRLSNPDILLVALGAPRQDEWLSAHLGETGAAVGIGVGGLFDFYSGRIPRAPIWMRELGLEWVFRLCQEPRRMWRRYLVGNVWFVARVLSERWGMASPILES